MEFLHKSFSFFIMLLAAYCFLHVGTARAEPATFCAKVVGVKEGDVLNVRAKPSLRSKIVAEFYNYAELIVDLRTVKVGNSVWGKVLDVHDSTPAKFATVGWVNLRYVEKDQIQACTARHLFELGISISSEVGHQLDAPFRSSYGRHQNTCPFYAAEEEWIGDEEWQQFSVSDEMLSYFVSRGFSLETLCLVLKSTRIQSDPETDVALPLVVVRSSLGWIPLNVPDCFAKGTPLLDCRIYFHWFWGYAGESERWEGDQQVPTKAEFEAERMHWKKVGQKLHEVLTNAIKQGQVKQGILTRSEFERLAGATATNLIFGHETAKTMGPKYILVSRSLPRGYAYLLTSHTVAGDDLSTDTTSLGPEMKQRIDSARLNLAAPWKKQSAPASSADSETESK